jgi:hypothetical protein
MTDMLRWRWLRIHDQTTPLDQLIRLLNERLKALAEFLGTTPTDPPDTAIEVGRILAGFSSKEYFVRVTEDDQWLDLATIPASEVEVGGEFRAQRFLYGSGTVRLNANIKALTGTPTIKVKYTTNAFGAVADLITWVPLGTGLRTSAWVTIPAAANADVGLTLYIADGGGTATLQLYALDAEFLPRTATSTRVHTDAHTAAFN